MAGYFISTERHVGQKKGKTDYAKHTSNSKPSPMSYVHTTVTKIDTGSRRKKRNGLNYFANTCWSEQSQKANLVYIVHPLSSCETEELLIDYHKERGERLRNEVHAHVKELKQWCDFRPPEFDDVPYVLVEENLMGSLVGEKM